MNDKKNVNLNYAGRVPEPEEQTTLSDSIKRKMIATEKMNPNAAKIRKRLGLPPLEEL